MTQEEELLQLKKELEAYRKAANVLHPQHTEPRFFIGQWVVREDKRHRIAGRSLDWDGNAEYQLESGGNWYPEKDFAPYEHLYDNGLNVSVDDTMFVISGKHWDEEGNRFYALSDVNTKRFSRFADESEVKKI